MRSCLLLLVLLTQALTSSAQVELSLEDFTIASSETKELSLILPRRPIASRDAELSYSLPRKPASW